ncbi:hypothetical protein QJS83_04790 [Bdellovibrio sp. 22V]|uniref:hypothetical protein n=1 Tax=Bdellovibrio TaxID=958 RepID=UPI002543DFD8|nr:hypothetical protein [Bdellovibrio sp. 22V]WII73188.1 hypothetical protein QJS83_04790 [Bdellovibrio sp. 22V]
MAYADWGVGAGTGSYMGDRHFGVNYTSESQRHMTEFSYGETPGILGGRVRQLNLKYVYSPLQSIYHEVTTNWIGIGALLSRCLCSDTFVTNPDVYPESNYYDETAYRVGLVFATKLNWRNWEGYWDWTLLDQVAIAIYNNNRYASKPEAYWASGFGVRYYF